MKFAVVFVGVIVIFLALVQQSTQLKCYQCKYPDVQLDNTVFNTYKVCNEKIEDSFVVTDNSVDFLSCLKYHMKVRDAYGKEQEAVVRTIGRGNDPQYTGLNVEKCSTDLCNSASETIATTAVVFLSTIALYFRLI